MRQEIFNNIQQQIFRWYNLFLTTFDNGFLDGTTFFLQFQNTDFSSRNLFNLERIAFYISRFGSLNFSSKKKTLGVVI